MKAKTFSLAGKVFALCFIVVTFVLKAIFGWAVEAGDIVKIGLAAVAITSPIDFSIWIDKFVKKGP